MAIAILTAVVVLLVVALVVAVWAAARARRQFPLAWRPAPWSSCELDGLSSDLPDVSGHDPIAALARADSAADWGRPEPKPAAYAPRHAEMASIAALEPVADARGDVPVVVLVPGAGFLGTGSTTALLERAEVSSKAVHPSSRPVGERHLRLA
jgi:hypothetical protein